MSVESSVDAKPPNVVIYAEDSVDQFQQMQSIVKQSLDCSSRYAVYQLHEKDVLQSNPWTGNVSLLVIAGSPKSEKAGILSAFADYVKNGGKAVGFGGLGLQLASHLGIVNLTKTDIKCESVKLAVPMDGVEELFSLVEVPSAPISLAASENASVSIIAETASAPVIFKCCVNTGMAIVSLARLDLEAGQALADDSDVFVRLKQSNSARHAVLTKLFDLAGMECRREFQPPSPTIGHLACSLEFEKCLLSGKSVWPGQVTIEFHESEEDDALQATDEKLPVVFCRSMPNSCGFDWHEYERTLKTKTLGRSVLYIPVISSTQTLFDGNIPFTANLPQEMGFMAVASFQTAGRGRKKNVWLSPVGCMMVSFHLRLEKGFHGKLSFLQHIVCVAAVEAIRSMEGYEDVDLRVKWPNDIYYGKHLKLGGVLVSSFSSGSTFNCVIGCGLNVSNSNPTVCVNDILKQHSRETGKRLGLLSVELVLARTLNAFEALLEKFTANGESAILPLYYEYWIHSNQNVTYQDGVGNVYEGKIIGINEYGYLEIEDETSSEKISVGPDDNTFDSIKGLISLK